MDNQQLAVVYAALLLQDDDLAVISDKLVAVLKAAGVEIEPVYCDLYAKAIQGVNVKVRLVMLSHNVQELIIVLASGVGSGPAPTSAPANTFATASVPAAEDKKKKEEPKEESDEDMGFGLFD